MVAFTQHPNVITCQIVTGSEPVMDSNGDWVQGGETVTEISYKGRKQPNGEGKQTTGEDGTMVNYSYLIHLPQDCQVFPYGAKVLVDGVAVGTVKNFDRNQLKAWAWV